jgi:hypothetical protein
MSRSLKKGLKYIHCRGAQSLFPQYRPGRSPHNLPGWIGNSHIKACRVFGNCFRPGFPRKIGAGKLRPACKIERKRILPCSLQQFFPNIKAKAVRARPEQKQTGQGRPAAATQFNNLVLPCAKSCGQGRQ